MVKLSKDVLLSSFTHSLPIDGLLVQRKNTKNCGFSLAVTYIRLRTVRDVSQTLDQPDHTVTRAKKTYPLQRLRSESKCVMADSLWICVDYLYLVHNGVIVDPLKEPAASGTRPSSRH